MPPYESIFKVIEPGRDSEKVKKRSMESTVLNVYYVIYSRITAAFFYGDFVSVARQPSGKQIFHELARSTATGLHLYMCSLLVLKSVHYPKTIVFPPNSVHHHI